VDLDYWGGGNWWGWWHRRWWSNDLDAGVDDGTEEGVLALGLESPVASETALVDGSSDWDLDLDLFSGLDWW